MGNITVVGLGWTAGQLTLEAAELLRRSEKILLHTDRCGCAEWLKRQGIAYESLDALYEAFDDFDEHAEAAAKAVFEAAREGDVVYGVFDVRDRSVAALTRRGDAVRIVAGPSAEGALLALADGAVKALEASDWEAFQLYAGDNCLIRELDSRQLASEVKLKLQEVYPEAWEIYLLQGDEAPSKLPLYALDRAERYDHRTCVLAPACREVTALERYDFNHLNAIMRVLCGPSGCPWDRVQTHASLKPYILEEAYEVIDAIDAEDPEHLYDELGDVLLQVALHAEIARRHGEFDISDVTTAICEKMIHRHSHIFGEDRAEDADAVVDLWARNKMAERGERTRSEVMRNVTKALPALLRAVKVLKRAAEAGFSEGELAGLIDAACGHLKGVADSAKVEAELGNALLCVAAIARRTDVDPELALSAAVTRFIDRFERLEVKMREDGVTANPEQNETLREYWDLVKL